MAGFHSVLGGFNCADMSHDLYPFISGMNPSFGGKVDKTFIVSLSWLW
jgi:hypothetical protein